MPTNNTQSSTEKKHQLPICPVCEYEFKNRVKRSMAIKIFLFWYPVKRYFCDNCLECYYILKPKYNK